VIEVKRRTLHGWPVFDDEAEKQARYYATSLRAPFYGITDGNVFRLFKKSGELIGDYEFSLEEVVKVLLRGLSDIYVNRHVIIRTKNSLY